MIRFVLRCFAILFLALAVAFAIFDGARSVGASQPVARPLLSIWSYNSPETLYDAQALVAHYIGEGVWNAIVVPMLAQPGWFIFGVLALLFFIVGYRRRRPLGRFTA